MKKILIFAVIALFASSSAYAASTTGTVTMDLSAKDKTGLSIYGDDTSADLNTALIGKTSTGVGVGIYTTVLGYALSTQHMNGTKAYASSYDSTSIYSTDASTGSPKLATLDAIDTANFSGWDAM